MTGSSHLKVLLSIQIFLGLFHAIVSNEAILEDLSIAQKRSLFGTEDGSVPPFQLVALPRSIGRAQATFEVTFNDDGIVSKASLDIVDDHNIVGRDITGVWYATSNASDHHGVTYTPRPDILNCNGEYELYQNVTDGSAVTKFWDSEGIESYIGTLKKHYIIKSLPENFISTNEQDENASLFVVIFKNPEATEEYFPRRTHESSILPELDLHRRRRENPKPTGLPSVVYPKLLISLDYAALLLQGNEYALMKLAIAHLNFVDMVFCQLNDPEVRIVATAILISGDEFATPFIAKDIFAPVHNILPNVLHSTSQYFRYEEHRFPHKSYDVAIAVTKNSLFGIDHFGSLKEHAGGSIFLAGSPCGSVDCLTEDHVHPVGAIVLKYNVGFPGIYATVHHLGHVFGVSHDGKGVSAGCQENDGYTMVSDVSLARTLAWSACSKRAFSLFFRSEQAKCTHTRPNDLPDSLKTVQGTCLSARAQQKEFPAPPTPSCKVYGCWITGAKNICDTRDSSPTYGSCIPVDSLKTNIVE